MAGPRLPIDTPPFTASPYGLLSVVNWINVDTPHWQNGVTWQSHCLASGMGGTTYDECIAVTGVGALPEPSVKVDNVDSINRGATPFTPYVRFDCSPVGLRDADTIARDALAQSESYQVERALWTGQADAKTIVFPHLAAAADVSDGQSILLQSTASVAATGAFDPATGLGLLEAALASCYNGVGVVHIPVKALPTLAANDLVERDGGRDGTTGQLGRRLRTGNGNLVAVGAGYPGTSPSGVAPANNQAWIYATGAIFGYRSPVTYTRTRDSLDRSTNVLQLIAERTYVLGWDCCHVAILINLGVPVT